MTTRNTTSTTKTPSSSRTRSRRSPSAVRLLLLLALIPTLIVLMTSTASAKDGVKIKEINFEPDQIEGDLRAPGMTTVHGEEERDLLSLVKARPDFTDRLYLDVLDL